MEGNRKKERGTTRMTGKSTDNNEGPVLNIEGEFVALGPLRRDLLPIYQRWINDLGTMRTLGSPPHPMTSEKEQDWYASGNRKRKTTCRSRSMNGRRCGPSATRGCTAWTTATGRPPTAS